VIRGTGAQFWVDGGVQVRVVDAGGGRVVRIDDHGSPLGYDESGVDYRTAFPRGRTELRAVVEVTGFTCPGGGDFVAQVLTAFGRHLRVGPNGGDHMIWLSNPPASGVTCRSQNVPNTEADREKASGRT
jgi:hypothetical protein